MVEDYALVAGRRPVRDSLGALVVAIVALILWSGCAAGHDSTSLRPPSGQQQLAASIQAGGAIGSPAQKGKVAPVEQGEYSLEEEARCGPEFGPVSDTVTWARLCRATVRAASRLPDRTAQQLLTTVTPHRLPTLQTMSSLWLGLRGKPVVEDVVARAWPGLMGTRRPGHAQRLSHALWSYVNWATFARTQEDLSQAASALEEAVEAAGAEAVAFLLSEGLLSSRARLRDSPPGAQLAAVESALPVRTPAPVVLARATAEAHQDTLAVEGCDAPPPGWPDFSSSTADQLLGRDIERLPAPFFSCTSPAAFVALQRRVDMARLVQPLDDWSAVRLGALGPVLPAAAEILNHKRASFLVAATQEYAVAQVEVFALFVLNTAFDKDIERVLRILSEEKRIGQTLGQMAAAREQLRRRGIDLADYPDRPERFWEDSGRGALEGTGSLLLSVPMLQTGPMSGYVARKQQLPPPYSHALDEVESTLSKKALEPGSVLLGVLDEMTFGAPFGFYYLVAGLGHGAYSATQGEYEQAARELTPVALVAALYAAGKGISARAKARGVPGTSTGATRALQGLELRLEELKATAERLRRQLGSDGLQELARYLRADPEAALLVAEGGEVGATALYEARGNVPKAQAWLSEMKSDRPSSSRTQGGVEKSQGSVASLADYVAGPSREVLETKLLELELETPGPRLSGNVALLDKQLSALEKNPPAGATGNTLWSEYLDYSRARLADLLQSTHVRKGRTLEPPLKWEGYQEMRGLWLRGLTFERDMAKLLRDDAALPQAQRRFLQDFEAPRVETYVGVSKPTMDLRFSDVLVIEQKPLPGQTPRVETFSFKSRDFSGLTAEALEAQMKADAREALLKYGGALDIRRPGLEGHVDVQRIRLIYEGGKLKPADPREQRTAVNRTAGAVPGVEVLFR